MKYKHIIWDYNGTLLNDVDLCVEIMNKMLKLRNLPLISIEKYKQIFDFPVKDYYQRAGINFKLESFDIVGLEFIKDYDLRTNELQLHEGSIDFLNLIFETGISQSILSARNQKQLSDEINRFKIEKLFSAISGLNDNYASGKNSNGQKLISNIKIPKNQIILIGDTIHDFEIAESNGIDCIIITHGHQSEEVLKEKINFKNSKNSVNLVSNFMELKAFLKK